MTLEYITLFVYFGFLLLLGGVFARFNRSLSDFVRGGAQGTWWLVGTSITVGGISAFTFTGNGSAAFEAGPSLFVIYAANLAGLALGGLFLGPWFRQTRAFTSPDVIRGRFGTLVEQFSIYIGLPLGPLSSAIQLWALGVFVSAVFGLPLIATIIVIGLIVLLYSVTGGRWAVMATDVVQGIVLFGITILVGILALVAVGGIGGFMEHVRGPEIGESFRWIKEPGQFPNNRYTLQWAIVIFMMQLLTQIHLATANRYLAVKDGPEAKKASWWAFFLMAVGTAVWFIPPMVARFLYAEEVLALPMNDPATGAYAVAARNLLPNGLMGIMIAAMFAATMSSMDTGINGQTGVIVHNIIGRIREWMKLGELPNHVSVRLCRIISCFLGVTIICMSLLLATQEKIVLFDSFLLLSAVVGTPLVLPLVVGLVVRKLPSWSYFLIGGSAIMPSFYAVYAERVLDYTPWTIQERGMWVLLFGLGGTVLSIVLARFRSARQREREKVFFETMLRPIDFEKEIGENKDAQQARLVGWVSIAFGGCMALILLVPNTLTDRLIILSLVVFVGGLGGLLLWSARRIDARSPQPVKGDGSKE